MRIVVYPHELGMGGSQLNAVELAGAVRDLGHDVLVFGRRGALVERVEELGLEFVEAPPPGKRPSPSTARALRALVQERAVDLVHGYEWPPTLDAVLAFPGGRHTAIVSTVMSMSVPPFIPRSIDLVVGTEQIADAERRSGRARVSVIEPPVDLAHNHPTSGDASAFRAAHQLDLHALTVVSVARFARELKLEGTLTAIEVIGRLARSTPVQLVLVGDGPARDDVARAAAAANAVAGRRAVVLTGQLDDPRPAYAAADIALGMGGSALRALAFGAPLIVQGEQGFWRTCEPSSLDQFLWTGWYGVGEGTHVGAAAFDAALSPLLTDAARRAELGAFGLTVVRERFSLTRAAEVQAGIYAEAASSPASYARASEAAAYARYARYYGAKRVRRALGRESMDDFNAKPVAGRGTR
ncbi:glycosyltransferase family 4 protein [Microbacterium lushaniae]|uniref:D-inositol 3-phosphate glycosyltransferase n=1 Tax=Microbacterium lushaniae TaxID=2614639 RepID=A0A5J6L157_9MICO|nr:glycosyltransferase family 4 protein [Microbacterium lushaniae]QEW02191.1 glycosyltransferase family 4 protein [Microbacterium lushaniae]